MLYATRNDAFSPARTFELAAQGVVVDSPDKAKREIPFRDIVGIELAFAPTRPERNRYRCGLLLQKGETIEFFNRTYRGVYDFHDTSAEYVAFVRALHEAVAQRNPACRFAAGVSGGRYALNVAALVFAALVVAVALVCFLLIGLVWVVAVKLILIAFYAPAALRWLKRNQPRTYDPRAIPSELLPTTH